LIAHLVTAVLPRVCAGTQARGSSGIIPCSAARPPRVISLS